ncbi:MAG: hypothetical protein NC453_16695 [Muribaculum sp.]|nr:hypothetical protein [Muribaculum sp.]
MTQPIVIKTNIKFKKGLDSSDGRVYGFVTKIKGSWRGCHEEAEKKKIVFVDTTMAKDIIPDALYCCSLVRMRNDQGFIVKTAKLLKFEATMKTICNKNTFMVSVKFGNKLFIYDPSSSEQRKKDIQGIANLLRSRVDLVDPFGVANEFVNAACMVKHLYEQSE